jgi:hypothetical protein
MGMSGQLATRVLKIFGALVGILILIGFGIAAYAAHLRTSARELIESARTIRNTADAEREIIRWRQRSGKQSWTETDHPGGDHNYDALVENLAIARLRVVEPAEITVSITMREGKLRCVTVIESTGWYPMAQIWIQEWFDPDMPRRVNLGIKGRPPTVIFVEFPSSISDAQRTRAFALNTNCLMRPRGCRSVEEILPGVLQLQSEPTPD